MTAKIFDSAAVKAYFSGLQAHIVGALEDVDGGIFRTDAWTRPAVPCREPVSTLAATPTASTRTTAAT